MKIEIDTTVEIDHSHIKQTYHKLRDELRKATQATIILEKLNLANQGICRHFDKDHSSYNWHCNECGYEFWEIDH